MLVSIIIPTANRGSTLIQTLESVASLATDWERMEVLVVDNGAPAETRLAFEHVRSRFPERRWRYLYEPVPGLLSGRHRGALEARGDVCAFLDDDVRLGRDWPAALTEAFIDPRVALVGGPSTPLFQSSPPPWLVEFYSENHEGIFCGWLSLFDGGARLKEINPCFVWGLNFSIRKEVLFEYGGFHPDNIPKPLQRFQGDGETGLSLNLGKAGRKALYHPEASVQHDIPQSRLTAKYFEERAFYQGVCDSYTFVRAAGKMTETTKSRNTCLGRVKHFLRGMANAANRFTSEVRDRAANSYSLGYQFHQDEVRHDPKLLDWVLRDHYWDCFLPDGWQMYAKSAWREQAPAKHIERA